MKASEKRSCIFRRPDKRLRSDNQSHWKFKNLKSHRESPSTFTSVQTGNYIPRPQSVYKPPTPSISVNSTGNSGRVLNCNFFHKPHTGQ